VLLGVDVGGTFTDAVLLAGGELHTAKLPTDADDQSAGVLAAVREVLTAAGAEPADVEVFAHGMTVGTNALLEERGARTALVTTRGFADLIEIGRQDRPHLYRLCEPKPRPLVEPELRFEVAERAGPDGIAEPLDENDVSALAETIAATGAESVAVCFLFSFVHPEHEARVAERLRDELDGIHVSASHEVLPQFREYERFSTTVIDAYLSPLLAASPGSPAQRPTRDCPSL
jgi:N-methylhydantoinase A